MSLTVETRAKIANLLVRIFFFVMRLFYVSLGLSLLFGCKAGKSSIDKASSSEGNDAGSPINDDVWHQSRYVFSQSQFSHAEVVTMEVFCLKDLNTILFSFKRKNGLLEHWQVLKPKWIW